MRRLNGYRATHRNKWLFIQYGILNVQEIALLEFYADVFDFDKNHLNHGLFKVDFKETRQIFNCKSENTVRNWHNKLLRLGFIEKTEKKHLCKLTCFERYINPGFWGGKAGDYAKLEKDKSIEAILQNFGINLQSIEEKLQSVVKNETKIDTKAASIAIDSSRVRHRVNKLRRIIKQKIRSNGEYQKIWKEDRYKYLTPEDMRWIDGNVKELEN